jgi:hypothetical protein
MSEFKFACPVCGQHITCDSGTSGTQMACPTCFRKLVVPPAKAADSPNLVLSASEVQRRTIPLPGAGQGGNSVAETPTRTIPVAVLALLAFVVCAAGAGVFIFRGKIFQTHRDPPPAETNSPPPVPVVVAVIPPLPAATNWTLNLAEAKIPDEPVNGGVNGRGFTLQRATIQQGRLDLRQGPKWPPDVGVSVHLFAERSEDLAGRSVTIEATRTNAPRIVLRWKDEHGEPATKDYRQGYALRVEFGAVSGNHLPGKIFIALPDEPKSYAAGTFSAEIRKSSPKK